MWFCGCLRKRLVWLGFVVLYVPKPVLPFFLLFFVSLFFSFFLSYVFTSPWKACRLSSLCLYCLKKGKSWSFLVVQQVTNSASSLLWLWVAAVVQASSLAWELPLAVGETKKKKKRVFLESELKFDSWLNVLHCATKQHLTISIR